MVPKPVDLTGQRFGRLVVLSRAENSVNGKSRWLCQCDCGSTHAPLSATLLRGEVRSCGCLQRELAAARMAVLRTAAEDVGYSTAHKRVRTARGSASQHACVDCDGQAREWSLKHDADTRTMGPAGSGFVCAFSPSPEDYDPRCVSCHRTYDRSVTHITRTYDAPKLDTGAPGDDS